jgi:hypothetical protein
MMSPPGCVRRSETISAGDCEVSVAFSQAVAVSVVEKTIFSISFSQREFSGQRGSFPVPAQPDPSPWCSAFVTR